jgi:hypothetical protein
MATDCLPKAKSSRSTDERDNLLLLPAKVVTFAAMGSALFAIVAPLFTGEPAPPRIDPFSYILIGVLGVVVMTLLVEQQRRVRELERLLKDHDAHAEPVAGSDGG